MKGRIGAVTISMQKEGIVASGPSELVEPLLKAAMQYVMQEQDMTTNGCITLRQFIRGRGGVIEEDCTPEDICNSTEGIRDC